MWVIKKENTFFAGETKTHKPIYTCSVRDAIEYKTECEAKTTAMRLGVRADVEIYEVQSAHIEYA